MAAKSPAFFFSDLLNRNVRLLFLSAALNGVSQGIFTVVFNLYILSLGITPDVLGGILAASPFAQALGSIPIGFLMEIIGFKKVFVLIYSISGLAKVAQIATASVPLISGAAFIGGLALSGDFVVRLPFLAANSTPERRTQVYSVSSILYSISIAVGALLAGFAPNIIQQLTTLDLAGSYRVTLYFAGFLSLVAVLPCIYISEQRPFAHTHKISLSPYLWGMDRFTVQQAVVSLFVGVSLGLTTSFMNIYFVYHLGATREFFGTVSALSIIPSMLAAALGPALALAAGSVRAVTLLRLAIPAFLINFALTGSRWSGTISYWGSGAFNTAAQPLSFAFAMRAAAPRARSAASAWLNVTFWLGSAMAAPLAGALMAQSNYRTPLFIAAGSIFLAGLFNEIFFRRVERRLEDEEVQSHGIEAEAS